MPPPCTSHPMHAPMQVLDASLEAHVLRSDSSALAKDCRKEIKAIMQQISKLGSRYVHVEFLIEMCCVHK